MSTKTPFLVLKIGICLWAGLIFGMAYETPPKKVDSCRQIKEADQRLSAEQIYAKAFTLSFDKDSRNAEPLSACAAMLHHGNSSWRVTAQTLIH